MNAINKRKITKKQFEYELYKKHNKIIEYNPYDEYNYQTNKSTRVYLYYVDSKHIGSWCKGFGWEFKHN